MLRGALFALQRSPALEGAGSLDLTLSCISTYLENKKGLVSEAKKTDTKLNTVNRIAKYCMSTPPMLCVVSVVVKVSEFIY